jgi:hypothetical protein
MLTHVYHLRRTLHRSECRYLHSLGLADEGHDRPIRVATGIHVKQTDSSDGFYYVGDLLYDGVAATF